MLDETKDIPELEPYVDEYSVHLRRIQKLAHVLDARFSLPGTRIRFGYDSLVGLLPGVGDTLTLIPQLFLLYEAVRLKLGKRTLLKMGLNVATDWLVGTIPVFGDLFDLAFKSNVRNAKLVTEAIHRKREAALFPGSSEK